jgi:hypothetical protein
MGLYDTEQSVNRSFDTDFMPEEQLQAQWAEFIELKKVITEQAKLKQRPISILDIGIGNARVPKHLCGIEEIWKMIAAYDGIDNADACISISEKVISDLNIGDKVTVSFLEANQLQTIRKKYDLVITTWFTAGNFYPVDFPFESYKDSGKKLDLTTNERFTKIFSDAYDLLTPQGEIVLGACYIDSDATRKKQEGFYKKTGMTIITDEKDSFTATREKFWSQRFTKEKMISYLSFTTPENILFTPLDTYTYAMQVRVKK